MTYGKYKKDRQVSNNVPCFKLTHL